MRGTAHVDPLAALPAEPRDRDAAVLLKTMDDEIGTLTSSESSIAAAVAAAAAQHKQQPPQSSNTPQRMKPRGAPIGSRGALDAGLTSSHPNSTAAVSLSAAPAVGERHPPLSPPPLPMREPIALLQRYQIGTLEKYSVGRGYFTVRNWKQRFFVASHRGMYYTYDTEHHVDGAGGKPTTRNDAVVSRLPAHIGKKRGWIPFISIVKRSTPAFASSTYGGYAASEGGKGGGTSKRLNGHNALKERPLGTHDVRLYPVFLLPDVPPHLHPEAIGAPPLAGAANGAAASAASSGPSRSSSTPPYYYFAILFYEAKRSFFFGGGSSLFSSSGRSADRAAQTVGRRSHLGVSKSNAMRHGGTTNYELQHSKPQPGAGSEAHKGGANRWGPPLQSLTNLKPIQDKRPLCLLLRTKSRTERDDWVQFLSLFLHIGSIRHGFPVAHPMNFIMYPKPVDPEDQTGGERKRTHARVMRWDEGEEERLAAITLLTHSHRDYAAYPLPMPATAYPAAGPSTCSSSGSGIVDPPVARGRGHDADPASFSNDALVAIVNDPEIALQHQFDAMAEGEKRYYLFPEDDGKPPPALELTATEDELDAAKPRPPTKPSVVHNPSQLGVESGDDDDEFNLSVHLRGRARPQGQPVASQPTPPPPPAAAPAAAPVEDDLSDIL